MDRMDRCRSFAHCSRDTVIRSGPYITCREYSGYARLECQRRPLDIPAARATVFTGEICTSKNEAGLIALKDFCESVGMRKCADKNEHCRSRYRMLLP